MNLLKYLFSRYFLRQLFISSIIVSILSFFVFIFLNFNTNHNRYISVPDLVGKNLLESKEILNVYKLKFEISDSTFFDPSFPKFTVLSHFPNANSKVKKNRKIYLTINPTNYSKVAIPEIIPVLLSKDRPCGIAPLISQEIITPGPVICGVIGKSGLAVLLVKFRLMIG